METNPKWPRTRPQPGSKGIVAPAIFLSSASDPFKASTDATMVTSLNPGFPGNQDYLQLSRLCRHSRKVAGEIVEAMHASIF